MFSPINQRSTLSMAKNGGGSVSAVPRRPDHEEQLLPIASAEAWRSVRADRLGVDIDRPRHLQKVTQTT